MVAVGVANLRPCVVVAEHRPPNRLDPLRLQIGHSLLHVLDLERHHAIAKMFQVRLRRDRNTVIGHQLDCRSTKTEIDEVQDRAARPFDPVARSDREAQHLGVELHCVVEFVGDDFDVIDALEHGCSSTHGTSIPSSGPYCWLPKMSASPGLPLTRRRRRVNLIAKAGSNATWSVISSASTPKIRHTAARDSTPLCRTRS